mgnify:CR=1 FL=1
MRKAFPLTVERLMKKDKRIFCLLGDIGVFSFRNIFKNYKNRIFNMSTMEQSMIGFGSGLSRSGFIPIIHTIAPFLVLRALDQIKIDFVYNKLPCNIVSVGASNDYSKLGTVRESLVRELSETLRKHAVEESYSFLGTLFIHIESKSEYRKL